MEIPDAHFRHILFNYFRKGENAVQAREKLYDVYGKNHQQNASARIGLLVFVAEILTSNMHHALDAQLKLTTTK